MFAFYTPLICLMNETYILLYFYRQSPRFSYSMAQPNLPQTPLCTTSSSKRNSMEHPYLVAYLGSILEYSTKTEL